MQAIDSTTGGAAPGEEVPGGEVPGTAARDGASPDRLRNLAVVCAVFFVLAFVGHFGNVFWQLANLGDDGHAVPNDMSIFWAAAKIGLEGAPVEAFDLDRLRAARDIPDDLPARSYQMAWSYPPQFHALVLPLGLVSYPVAWLGFGLLGIAVFWLAMRRLVPDPSVVTVTCASPAVLMCVIQGQNSLIIGALLTGLLITLRAGRPASAGLLLGALTIKPQFGPLLPLALISAGAWRVIGWAALVSAVIVGLSLLWVGTDYWHAFIDGLTESGERMAAGWLPRELMISWYAFAVGAGAPHGTALTVQGLAMALLAGAVGWAWMRGRAPFALRAAVLAVAVPLFSPYVYYYDLVLPLIGVALVLSGGYIRRSPAGIALGVVAGLVWAAPTLGHFGIHAGVRFAFALLTAPVLTAFLALVLREIALARAHAAA